MTKWIYTGCLIIVIALMAGAATAIAVNELSDDMSEEGFGGGSGTIYRMGENTVVINDMKYKFASSTKFLSYTGDALIQSMFKKEDRVDFVLNSRSEISVLQKSK